MYTPICTYTFNVLWKDFELPVGRRVGRRIGYGTWPGSFVGFLTCCYTTSPKSVMIVFITYPA